MPTHSPLVELVEDRLGRLEPDERRALELVALAEPLEARALVEAAGGDLAESLEAKGLLRVQRNGRRLHVVVAQPIYAEMVRAGLPPLRRCRRYQELAETVSSLGMGRREDTARVTIWRLDAGIGQPVEHLLAAFREALNINDSGLAERLSRAAVEAGGGVAAAAALAEVLTHDARWDEAAVCVGAVWDKPMDPPARAQLAIHRAQTMAYGCGDLAAATAVLDEIEEQVADPAARQALAIQQIGLLGDAGQFAEAAARCESLLDVTDLSLCHRSGAESWLAVAYAMTGRTAEAIHAADRCIPAAPGVVQQLGSARFFAALYAGDLDSAEAEAGPDDGLPLALVRRLRGRVAGAVPAAPVGVAGYLLAESAHCAALRADLTAAKALLARTGFGPPWLWGRTSVVAADAWIAAQAGLITDAVSMCGERAAWARQLGMLGEEMFALHDQVRLDSAGQGVQRLVEIDSVHDGHLAPIFAAHARAMVAADPHGLNAVADRFAALGFTLFAAEAAARASRTFYTDGQRRPGAAAELRASQLAELCEGARTPAMVGLRAPRLSRREIEVGRLAVAGRRNKEIGAALFISPRTVERHLNRIFEKTGLSRREELAGLLN